MTETPEISVVIPCLNERETLGTCLTWARDGIKAAGITGEIVVADNGSTDGSVELAEQEGARVVRVETPGYGAALIGGIQAARGRWVLMGDADGSYDFRELPRFLERLRAGDDLVQGCRLPTGGGTVRPGAMPFLHRWVGNPLFSWLARRWFGAPIHDVYCGLRAFRREWWVGLDQRCTGMEFATEMIIKASLRGARIGEVPVTLHPDLRTLHPPHLKTFRDGWRTLRFFLLFSPRWLFLAPGTLLVILGVLGYALAMPRVQIGHVRFDVHTLLFASLAILLGHQAALFAIFTKTFAINEGLLPADPRLDRAFGAVGLERALVLGALTTLLGGVLLAQAVFDWVRVDFGNLDYGATLRIVIPGVTLTALGIQVIWSSFFIGVLGLKRR